MLNSEQHFYIDIFDLFHQKGKKTESPELFNAF